MKKINKNFIAFTLSEMMIVLLIVSVLSAATLPAITGKKKSETAPVTGSSWQKEINFDLGHYFIRNDNNNDPEVIIGADTSADTATQITASRNLFGAAALKLQRPVSIDLQEIGLKYANSGNKSDIAFYTYGNRYSGKLTADERGNIAIGEDAAFQHGFGHRYDLYGNLYLGHAAGAYSSTILDGNESRYNTVIGNNALRESGAKYSNVVIGHDTHKMYLGENNVILGTKAAVSNAFDSYPTLKNNQDSISIGMYSSHNVGNLEGSVNIGNFSGSYSVHIPTTTDNGVPYAINQVNIGDHAGFDAGYTKKDYGAPFSSINIGSYSGAYQANNMYKLYHTISIGNYAGFNAQSSLNIGSYAGARSNAPSSFNDDINIGDFAGYDSTSNINIGRYAGYANTSSTIAINIGAYSGYFMNKNQGTVNIGSYSGFYAGYGLPSDNEDPWGVNIGFYAGAGKNIKDEPLGRSVHIGYKNMTYSNDQYNVIIGCMGHRIKNSNRMCIGGRYIEYDNVVNKNNNNILAWNSNATVTGNVTKPVRASLFIPPGPQASSAEAWDYTRILLGARYIASFKTSFSYFSDKTLKENIRKTSDGIHNLRKLKVREFNMKGDNTPKIGLVAQEVMSIYPHRVSEEYIGGENDKKYFTVDYAKFIYSLVQSVKDLDVTVFALEKDLTQKVKDVIKLTARINNAEKKLDNIVLSHKNMKSRLNEIDVIIGKSEQK